MAAVCAGVNDNVISGIDAEDQPGLRLRLGQRD
jgi:hypothetical protein